MGEDYVLKVADFGLARDIYKEENYVKTTSVRISPLFLIFDILKSYGSLCKMDQKLSFFSRKETGFVLLFSLLLFSLLAYPWFFFFWFFPFFIFSIRSLLRYWVFKLALNENIAFPPDLK